METIAHNETSPGEIRPGDGTHTQSNVIPIHPPKFNRKDAETFFGIFNKNTPDALVYICTAGNWNGVGLPVKEAIEKAETWNEQGRDVYFMPSILSGQRNGKNSAAENDFVTGFRAVFVDIDEVEYYPQNIPLAPSLVISRGERCQMFWLIEPSGDAKTWKDTMRKLISFFPCADLAVKNPARWMRFPGSLRYKGEPGKLYALTEAPGFVYGLDTVYKAFPAAYPTKKVEQRNKSLLEFIGAKTLHSGSHIPLCSYSASLIAQGFIPDEMESECQKLQGSAIVPPRPQDEFDSIVKSAAEKFTAVNKKEPTEDEREAFKNLVVITSPALRVHIKTAPDVSYNKEAFEHKFAGLRSKNFPALSYCKQNGLIDEADIIEYEPGKETFFNRDGARAFNTYRVTDIEAAPGNVDWFLEHFDYLFKGSPDYETYKKHFFDYVAHFVQYPGKRIHHALLLMSTTHGNGKSLLFQTVAALAGKQNTRHLEDKGLEQIFNGWAFDCVVVLIEEAHCPSKAAYNNLKSLIGSNVAACRDLYKKGRDRRIFSNILATSNQSTPFLIEPDDRRFFVMQSFAEKRDTGYYLKLLRHIENDLPALLYFFKTRDISAFSHGTPPPMTDAKSRLIEGSKSDVENKLEAAIERARDVEKRVVIAVNAEFASYIGTDENGRTLSTTLIGRRLSDIGYPMEYRKIGKGTEAKKYRYRVINPDEWAKLNKKAQNAAILKEYGEKHLAAAKETDEPDGNPFRDESAQNE